LEQECDNETRKRRSLSSVVSVSDLSRIAGTLGEDSTIGTKRRNFVKIKSEQSAANFSVFLLQGIYLRVHIICALKPTICIAF
jgi:hypothetical protein